MNIFNLVKNRVLEIFFKEFEENLEEKSQEKIKESVSFDRPNNISNGDIATNIAMVSAKIMQKKPMELAERLVHKLKNIEIFKKIEIAEPGFINFIISDDIFSVLIKEIIKLDYGYGKNNIGNGLKVNLEFVSANPTGPMHIGHLRNAVFGESLANIMRFSGYDVTKEYYVNDAGGQINILAESVILRYREVAFGDKIEIPEGLYPGDYVLEVAKKLYLKYPDMISKEGYYDIEFVKKTSVEEMLLLIEQDLKLLGVEFDIFFSEKSLHTSKAIETSIKYLEDKSLTYRGVLEAPKGTIPEDYEPREQLLFKSTSFGDDSDRPVQKSDGSWAYFAGDIAYMKNKIDREFKKLIFILGADHGGYKPRLAAVCSALSEGKVSIDVKLMQLVRFVKDGEVVKMSKRSGNFLSAREVIEEVGKDAIFLTLLSRKNDQSIDFDFDKVVAQNKDNPVFYIQYASARISSILRTIENDQNMDHILSNKHEEEFFYPEPVYDLIKLMSLFPKIVEQSVNVSEPHRLVFYLIELASSFHQLWNLGKEYEELRFVQSSNIDLTGKYVFLLKALKIVLRNGLKLFNIEALEKM